MFRLMLVEDEYIEREAMKHIIARRYKELYEIQEAENGKKAMEVASTFLPDVVFLDIKMPGYSGIEVATQLRKQYPKIIIVFITAYDCFEYAMEAIALKVEDFILKPVEIEETYKVLERITKKLEQEKKSFHQSKEMEFKFTLIKKQFEIEFFELLNNYNTSKEQIDHYLEIMDIKVEKATVAIVNFTSIDQYEKISGIQKDFIRERCVEKIKQNTQKKRGIAITGEMNDYIEMIFFSDGESNCEWGKEVESILEQSIQIIGMTITYYIGKTIQNISKLSEELYLAKREVYMEKGSKGKKYPYDLEELLVDSIKNNKFDKAIEYVEKIADILKDDYTVSEFRREVLGLYAIIKRSIIRNYPMYNMASSDELVENIVTATELVNFFNHIFHGLNSELEKKCDKNYTLIQKIRSFVEEHYREDITLEQAAGVVGYSTFYFAKLMREYFNMSFVDYLTSVRISKAKELLQNSELSVKEVGYEVGFHDPNYFTRVFKRVEGLTPSQYKTNIKKMN